MEEEVLLNAAKVVGGFIQNSEILDGEAKRHVGQEDRAELRTSQDVVPKQESEMAKKSYYKMAELILEKSPGL